MADPAAPQLQHLRALDGLRGIAVLAVVLYHFSPGLAPGGFFGVDIFFVLSGFLITSLLVNEWEGTRRISLRHFWARRARRLLPALFLVLAAVGIYTLVSATKVEAHHIGEDGLAAFGYVANWHFISSGQGYVEQFLQQAPSPLRHTWSLAIEEQFYLLWPLVVAGIAAVVVWIARPTARPARNQRRFRRVLAATCTALGVASLGLMVALFDARDANRAYYGTDTRAFLLLLGAAVGALTAGRLQITRRAPRTLMVVLGCVAAVALVALMASVETTDTWLYQGGYGIVAVLVTIVLAAAAQTGLNPLARIFEGRALVGLGLISYGVYLWHWPATVWLTDESTGLDGAALFALRAAATLVVSLASFWLVEQPIRRGRMSQWSASRRRALVVAATTAVAALLLVPVLAFASVAAPPNVGPSEASEATATTYATVPRCDGRLTYPPPTTPAAVPPRAARANSHPRVELVGNSVAVELIPCLAQLIEAQGGTLETVGGSAAPPCTLLPDVRKQVEDPATRPDVAIWFAFDWFNDATTCNTDWRLQPQEAIRIWKTAGTQVYLVPLVPAVVPSPDPNVMQIGTGPGAITVPAQFAEFQEWAAQDPAHITLVDPGLFVRDADGAYQWRMPCLPRGEPGCGDDGTIGVRWTDGIHFCADPAWDGTNCALEHSGGPRRVAAAIAMQLRELST